MSAAKHATAPRLDLPPDSLHNAFMYAMQTLLTGYVCVDEGDHSTQYYRLLREVVQELQELVKQHADKA